MSVLSTGFNSFMITPPPHGGITSKPLQILQTKVQGVCHLKTLLRNHNGFKALTSLKKPTSSWLKEKSYKDTVDPDSPEVKSTKVNTCVVKESDVIVDRMPLRVQGLSLSSILKLNASDSIHQITPIALSMGNLYWPSARFFTCSALSFWGD